MGVGRRRLSCRLTIPFREDVDFLDNDMPFRGLLLHCTRSQGSFLHVSMA